MSDTNNPRKRCQRRRLTSFSLRTALIAVTVLAVWLGLHMRSVWKQRTAIEAIQRHGGHIYYDYEWTPVAAVRSRDGHELARAFIRSQT